MELPWGAGCKCLRCVVKLVAFLSVGLGVGCKIGCGMYN